VREAREHGAKLAAIVLLPREEDLAQLELDHDRYWSAFAADLERRGMLVIDTTAELGPAWLAAHGDASKPRLYSGSHLSGAAYAIVARAVHAAIEAHLHDAR
jgi:lysophospholipase L1-like esterase